MSKVEQLYQRHLDSLRKLANEKSITFTDALMAVHTPLETNALIAVVLRGRKNIETEKNLIQRYRLEFFEWIANNAIDINESAIEKMANNKISTTRKAIAKNAANAAHDQPGGSRDKRAKLLEIYLRDYKPKGKTKTKCIEKECKKLGMSTSTGEKTLRNK